MINGTDLRRSPHLCTGLGNLQSGKVRGKEGLRGWVAFKGQVTHIWKFVFGVVLGFRRTLQTS